MCAYKRASPIPVVEGGTNAQSFATTDGVIIFDGTRLVTLAATGAAGTILTSNGVGVAPSFQAGAGATVSITGDTGGAIVSGSFTFAGGTTGLSFNGVGTTETLAFAGITANGGTVNLGTDNLTNAVTIGTGTGGRTINIGLSAANNLVFIGTSNGSAATNIQSGSGGLILNSNAGTATLDATSGVSINSTAGTLNLGDGANSFAVNVGTAGARTVTVGSTTTTSSLALRYGTSDFTLASATGTVMSALDTGEITYPLQPAFLATHGVAQNNATGNGAVATINFTTVVFDQNSDYDGTNTFTAPVTGRYLIGGSALFSGLDATSTTGTFAVVASNRTMNVSFANWGVIRTPSNQVTVGGRVLVDMDAADTVTIAATITGMAGNTISIAATAGNAYYSGSLVC